MKNTNYIVSGILTVAIIVLFVLHFAHKTHEGKAFPVVTGDSISTFMPVAYVDIDSLLVNFNFYNHLVGEYENKLSKQNGQLNQRYQSFQKEVAEFQERAQNNAFITQEKMRQENDRLARKQKEIEQSAAQAEQELALQQRIIQQQLADTISTAIKNFNNPPKYQLILTKTGVLYAPESCNITKDFVEYLNERYKVE
ncbi:MAG: OmpH family outer membrane protein [Dysgonamonadaceae bacterium]|jgi:outer membrane protein|nr:OmpH family outer membrane protein [Dysgonamonadaceae bacterium]